MHLAQAAQIEVHHFTMETIEAILLVLLQVSQDHRPEHIVLTLLEEEEALLECCCHLLKLQIGVVA